MRGNLYWNGHTAYKAQQEHATFEQQMQIHINKIFIFTYGLLVTARTFEHNYLDCDVGGWSDNRMVPRDTSLFEYVNKHLCIHQSPRTVSCHLISEFVLYENEDCLSHMILIQSVILVARKRCSYKMGTIHVHAAPKPGSNIRSYLPVFLKDGLVSLLEHALQWHHFLFQLTNQDKVIRASRIHWLSDWTTGGKNK